MAERIDMTLEEFDLLVRALHREWVQNPKCVTISDNSVFYTCAGSAHHSLHLFQLTSSDEMWPTLDGVQYRAKRPGGIFQGKRKKVFDDAVRMVKEITTGKLPESTEKLICKLIPSAKDIIAERALVGDHGNETSNSTP
jgi:hypothetical protein